jgi:hypothetical protein
MHFALCKKQQHSQKQDFFRDFGVAEAPPGFQAGWSDCIYFSFFDHLLILNSELVFVLTRYSAISEFSPGILLGGGRVSFVALGPLEPQTARL